MPNYTTTQFFPPTETVHAGHTNPALVVIQPGAGSVAIDVQLDSGVFVAIPGSPFTEDAVFHLGVSNGRFRFTPQGGAVYGFSV